jgi:transposase-like protein
MSRGSGAEKVAEWTNRLRRFEESGQTVTEFCLGEGVSQPSFYYWKKKLRESGATTAVPVTAPNGFRPVMVSPSTLPSARRETIVRLGREIQIELGSDLAIVEAIVKQLLAVTTDSNPQGTE